MEIKVIITDIQNKDIIFEDPKYKLMEDITNK